MSKKLKNKKKKIVVAVSGYFNPLHIGHVRLFEEAKKLGTKLVVIVNNDEQVKIKGSIPFMDEKERIEIVAAIAAVDNVILSIDKDRTVCKTLEFIRPDIFANGGDRDIKDAQKNSSSLNPEQALCKKLGIKTVFGVGKGGKVQSSSWLLEKINRKSKHAKK